MTGLRHDSGDVDPSDDWMSKEVEKQKERDAAEVGEAVAVVGETEIVAYASGSVADSTAAEPVDVEPITPEGLRAIGLEEARQAFSRGLVLVDLGREWLMSIGYRDETRSEASDAAEGLAHVIDLIEAGEGG